MNKQIKPSLRQKLARPFSTALTFGALTMVPAMVAVIAPANTVVAPLEWSIAGPGRYFGTDYTENPLHLPRRAQRNEIE